MAIGYGQIIGTAANVAGNIGSGVADVAVSHANQKAVKRNREMLKRLEEREALGLLGLTEEELQLAAQRGQNQAASGIRQVNQVANMQGAQAAGGNIAALAERDAAMEALGLAQSNLGMALTEADLAERAAEEEEIEARQAYDAQAKAARAQAVGNLLTGGILKGGAQAAQTGLQAGAFDRSAGTGTMDQGLDLETLEAIRALELGVDETMGGIQVSAADPANFSQY